jgi:HSP20 family protein
MLQLRTNQLFEDFHRSFGSWGLDRLRPLSEMPIMHESSWPRVDVSENDRELVVKAEMPGVDEKDIEVFLNDDMVTIRGNKRIEQEDKGKDYYRAECFHGSFTRNIPLPVLIELEKVDASFKKQVLTITLPKAKPEKQRGRKITIKSS